MNCHKCGTVLKEGMLFCPECGTKAEKQLSCIVCQSPIEPGAKFCSNCGAKITIAPEAESNSADPFSDFVYEPAEASTPVDAPVASPSNIDNSPIADGFEGKSQGAIKKKLSNGWFKLSIYSRIIATLIAIFALLGLFAFCFGKTAAGVLAIMQIALVVVSLLMKKQRIKTKKSWTHIVALVIAIVLIFPYVNLLSNTHKSGNTKPSISFPIGNASKPTSPTTDPVKEYKELQWPKNALATLIPVPTSIYGEVEYSTEEELSLRIDQVSQDDFYEYISACTDNGFVNVKEESASEFQATHRDGYRLTLSLSSDDEMSIIIQQPLYTIELTVDCLFNLLFNTYDIDVYLDGDEIGSMVHGEDATMNLNLEKGSYTLEVRKHGYKSPKGTVTIQVKENAKITYDAKCGEDVISLTQTEYISLRPLAENEARVPASASELRYDHYEDVVESLTEAGFTNIKTAILYDIVWGITSEGEVSSVSIAGDSNFEINAIFDKSAEVVVTYHMDEDDDPSLIKMAKAATDYEGKHYSDVVKTFKALGFTNVVLEQTKTEDASYADGEVYRVTIDSFTFNAGEAYNPTDKVLIKYYTYYVDPAKQAQAALEAALESAFPKNMAKRAVIVAMTNCQATDVFSADGNTYDPAKFHPYSDIGAFFMTVDTDGNWTAVNENTWRVEGIVLRIYDYDTYLKADCSIKKDGDNYIVFNVDRTLAAKDYINSDDPSKINTEHLEPSNSNLFLTVPYSLIKEDRNTSAAAAKITAKEKHQEWIRNQFHWWDGRHTELSDLIKDRLNDPGSFKHVDASYIDVCDTEAQTIVNQTLKSIGYSTTVEIGDLFVMQEFTAKNAFNATVRNTGYGIVRGTSNRVILLGFE